MASPLTTQLTSKRRPSIALAVGAATVAVLAIESYLLVPRFRLTGVALLDDWWYVVLADPHSFVGMLKQLFVDFGSDPGGRFRPAIAFWSYVEWHVTGAPRSVTGAHVVQGIRQAFFLVVIGALPLLLVHRRPEGRRIGPVGKAVVALLPPAAVLASSLLDVELFARSGPQEPALVSELLAGGLILLWVLERRLTPHRFGLLDALATICGYALVVLGALEKEVSPAFLVLAAVAISCVDRYWRKQGLLDRPLARTRVFQILAAACLLPFLREIVGVVLLFARGTRGAVYASTTTKGTSLIHTGAAYFENAWTDQHELALKVIGLFVGALVLLAVVGLRDRNTPLFEIGLVVTAILLLLLQSTGADAAPRYALPTVCLLAIACALLVARAGNVAVVVAACVCVVFLDRSLAARTTVIGWTDGFEAAIVALHEIDSYNPRACPVYMSSMTGSNALAMPQLAGRTYSGRFGTCRSDAAGVLLAGPWPGRASWADERILRACADDGWQRIWSESGYSVLTCAKFRSGQIEGERVSMIRARDRLLPRNRFLPPSAS